MTERRDRLALLGMDLLILFSASMVVLTMFLSVLLWTWKSTLVRPTVEFATVVILMVPIWFGMALGMTWLRLSMGRLYRERHGL